MGYMQFVNFEECFMLQAGGAFLWNFQEYPENDNLEDALFHEFG